MIQAIRALARARRSRVAAARHAHRRRPRAEPGDPARGDDRAGGAGRCPDRRHPGGARVGCGPGHARRRRCARWRAWIPRPSRPRCRASMPIRDWTVRVAQAGALGALPDGQGFARLSTMADDADVRVVPAVLAALAASKAPGAAGADSRQAAGARLRGPLGGGAGAGAAQGRRRGAGSARGLHRGRRATPTYVARAAILAALAQLDPAGTRPLLDEALKDKDWARAGARRRSAAEQKVTDGVAAAMRPGHPRRGRRQRRVDGHGGAAVLAARLHRDRQGRPSRSSWPCSMRRSRRATS